MESDIASSQESSRAAEFNVRSNEAGLKELRTNLKRTSIYAPASGIISKLEIQRQAETNVLWRTNLKNSAVTRRLAAIARSV